MIDLTKAFEQHSCDAIKQCLVRMGSATIVHIIGAVYYVVTKLAKRALVRSC